MASTEEATPFLHRHSGNNHWNRMKKRTMCLRATCVLSILALLATGVCALQYVWHPKRDMQKDFASLKDYCNHVQPIQPLEYVSRQKKLAETLKREGARAFIMEPGATMSYYTNIDWSLSERPFLVILRIDDDLPTGLNMTIVTPAFEATRARENLDQAKLPPQIEPSIVEWREEDSPYDAVGTVLNETIHKVFMETDVRLFIFDGVSKVLGNDAVEVSSKAIRTLRMVKSKAELDILRCVNHATELAIRKVRHHVRVGMTENDIADLMESALHTAGLTNTWVLALIDENAAFPHGEPGKTKRVTKDSTVLIDTGGELLGYQSDTTRTFFLGPEGFNKTIEDAWYTVRRAQEKVLNQAAAGMPCAEVDLTARHVIDEAGYGQYFTHRLGHGIGMEMHEEPYMNQGNTDQILEPGFTFSVEPGIYVAREFGIRLEDIVVVNQEGKLELLTSGLAQNPWSL